VSRTVLWRLLRLAVRAGDKEEAEEVCRRLGYTRPDTIRRLLETIHQQEVRR